MEPFQLPKIDVVNLRQISEIGTNKTTPSISDNNGIFRQTLNTETKMLDKSRTDFDVARTNNSSAVEKSLEKMVISLMMKPMFSEFAEFTFGKGVEADVYSSLFSDAVADEIAASGSFGLGRYTENLNLNDKSPVK